MSRRLSLGFGLTLLACTPRPSADLGPTTAPPTVREPESSDPTAADGSKPKWVDLAIESEFGCAVERTGAVQCWGRGPAAEMELRELPEQPPPESTVYGARKWGPASRLDFIDGARAVSTATTQACAIVEDGRVRCWGAVRWGSSHVYDVAGITGAVDLEVGDGESCARLESGELWCWSAEHYGIAMLRLTGTVAFSVGDSLACGLSESGDVRCWGQAIADWHRYSVQFNQQQVANGPSLQPAVEPDREAPDSLDVGRFRGAVDIALTGWNMLCVLRGDGKVSCASQDVSVLLRSQDLGMREVVGAEGLTSLSATRTHVCGRTLDDRAMCWGRNAYGQLGDGGARSRDTAAPVVGLTGVVELAVAEDLSCASTQAGEIHCWGFDRGEALAHESRHVHTLEGLAASSIAAFGRTTCATSAGTLRCWGGDSLEQTGIVEVSTPHELGLPATTGEVLALSTGWEGCVLLSSGTLHCGNWNTQGSMNLAVSTTLGDVLDYAAALPPVCAIVAAGPKPSLRCGASFTTMAPERQIDAPARVSAANMRACVVHGGGRVSCFGELQLWGSQPSGPREITRVEGIRDAVDVSSSTYHDCVLHKSGKVGCWVGRIDTQWSSDGRTPTAVRYAASAEVDMGLEKVVQVVAGINHHCALTSNAVVRCWADNPYGEGVDWRPVPELPDDVEQLAAGSEHTCARMRSGQVTCWGDDVWGQLGRVPSRVFLRPTPLPIASP